MNVGIIGLGLMGGSIGRAAVRTEKHKVFAFDIDEESMVKGSLLKAYHERLTHDNAHELDLLILAVLPSAVPALLDEYLPLLKSGATVTDIAGVKRHVVVTMTEYSAKYPDISFVGGHPMAGREFSGVAHSTAGLLENSTVLLVSVKTPLDALARLKEFYKELGAEGVVITTADDHDKMIAYTSQLAHVVSSAYVKSEAASRHYGYSAGSFRDMTRVARMNPAMWTELMSDNADNLIPEIRGIVARLNEYADSLENADKECLYRLLDEGNRMKLSVEKDRQKKLNDALDD